jgi:hypothetical protein
LTMIKRCANNGETSRVISMLSQILTIDQSDVVFKSILSERMNTAKTDLISTLSRTVDELGRNKDRLKNNYSLEVDAQGRKADSLLRDRDGLVRNINSIQLKLRLEKDANQRYADQLQREVDGLNREYDRRGTSTQRQTEINREKTTLAVKITEVRNNSNIDFCNKEKGFLAQIDDLNLNINSLVSQARSVRDLSDREGILLVQTYNQRLMETENNISNLKSQIVNSDTIVGEQIPAISNDIRENWEKVKVCHIRINDKECWIQIPVLCVFRVDINNPSNTTLGKQFSIGLEVLVGETEISDFCPQITKFQATNIEPQNSWSKIHLQNSKGGISMSNCTITSNGNIFM